ncbi:MAG: adenylate/guanylate cyclase domain-containing protein [Pseudomonadota bacterium]
MIHSDQTGEARSADASLDVTFKRAEEQGLRLAIIGRLVALVLMALWFGVSRSFEPERAAGFLGLLGAFAVLGIVHYALIGSRLDRAWVKYFFITVDLLVLTSLVVTQPMYPGLDLPQVVSYRNPNFPFYFVLLGIAAFSFSPGLVLWTGCVGAAVWLGGYFWVVQDMPDVINWVDLPTNPTREQFDALFLNANFGGQGSRVQEAVAFVVVAVLIALVMARARTIVRQQIVAERERAEVSQLFGRYVPPVITEALIADRGALAPVEREASILFIDLAGFTAMTERVGPTGTMGVLNEYFDVVSRIISERGGIITQFQGDAVLATFNVPLDDPDHARHAVEAALEAADAVNARTFAGEQLSIRAGIALGPVVAGSVGGAGRESYTVHGDTVNLAARLEAMNKEHGTHLLVSAAVAEATPDVHFQTIGSVPVRGLGEAVEVLTVAHAGATTV